MKYFRRQEISLTVQLMHLKRLYPTGAGGVVRDQIVWLQRIRPHALAHEYLCRLEYSRHWYPRVYIVEPKVTVLASERKLPHVRTEEEPIAMCLFYQEDACWHSGMLLAEIVVPMAYYWLACFEDWLFTGEWHGGGTHDIAPHPPGASPIFPSDLNLAQVA